MGIIKPTLNLVSNSSAATTDAGPLSIALTLSATDSLSVDTVTSGIITCVTGDVAPTKLLDGDALSFAAIGSGTDGDASDVAGANGSFLYMKNTSAASTTNLIYIGTTLQGATAPANNGAGTTALDNSDDASLRLMTLKVGEFCWMPWDYLQDIYVSASTASQTLEYFLFDRA